MALQALQKATVVKSQVVSEPEVQIKGFATVQESYASVLDSYVDRYGQDAALVASVVALAQRGELFDRDTADNAIVESSFYRVPNSTLIVNRVDTNDQYGESRTFTVLDGDEPLFMFDSGGIELNNLTLSQIETLQSAQREGANPLLVSESFFQSDVGQYLSKEGEQQARSILSQGDVLTPDMVADLNALLLAENEQRRQEGVLGYVGEVRLDRFTESELNQNLSTDTIARQLSALFPVLDVQAVTQPQAVAQPFQQPLQQTQESIMPNVYVYDRPKSEIERMETLALTLLQSGETLIAPATFTADGAPLLPPMQLSLSDQVGDDGLRLLERFYPDTDYSPGQRSLHTAEVLGGDGILQAIQDGTLQTADGQRVSVRDLLAWEVLLAPAFGNEALEDVGYVMTSAAEGPYRTHWHSATGLPLPTVGSFIDLIPDYDGELPTLKQLLDAQQVVLDREQQSPLAAGLLMPLTDLAAAMRQPGVESLSIQTASPDVMPVREGGTLEFANAYTVTYSAEDDRLSVYRPGREAAVLTAGAEDYFVDNFTPADAAFLQVKLPVAVKELQATNETQLVAMIESLGNSGTGFTIPAEDDYEGYRLPISGTALVVERIGTVAPGGYDYSYEVKVGEQALCTVYDGKVTLNELDSAQLAALRGAYEPLLAKEAQDKAYIMSLLEAGERLSIRTEAGSTVLSLSNEATQDGNRYLSLESFNRDGVQQSYAFPAFEEALKRTDALYAMEHGLMETQDGEQVLAPALSVQGSSPDLTTQAKSLQRSFDAPASVVTATANGQRMTATPQAPSPVAPNVQSPTLKPKQPKEVTMTVIEAPMPVDLKPIQLDDMLSEFSKDAMRGITGTRATYNPTTKRREFEERSPGETFAKFAKGAYGIENFCKDNSIPFQGPADYLVNKTALELDLSPEFKAEILSGIKREECVAPVILATENETAAWKRVHELQPETFAAVASPAMQDAIAQDASVIAQAKVKALAALGITVQTAEPTRDPAKLGYEPAPATPETAALIEFRDSLSASQLREWAVAVQVNEPQNSDKQKWIADFTAKFQKSGYEMSDGGMSVGMSKRLTEVQQQMEPDVAKLRTEMATTINQMLSQAPNVEGKDYKKLEATKLGLTIKGKEGNFEVKGATGKLLLLAKEGEVTINRLPATVVSRMEGMVAMQQQMQQASVQRTVAAPTKKVAVELTA